MQVVPVTYQHPLSPHFKFKFFYNGEILQSIFEYMLRQAVITQDTINEVYIARVGQDLYSQKLLFSDQDVVYTYCYQSETKWTYMLDACFFHLQTQFQYGLTETQVQTLVPPLDLTGQTHVNNIFDQAERFMFFSRSYPFVGKDRAVYLTGKFLEWKIYGHVQEEDLEELAKYEVHKKQNC